MQHYTAQYSAIQHFAALCSTLQHYATASYSRLLYIQHYTTASCSRLLYIQHYTTASCSRLLYIQHYTTASYSSIWQCIYTAPSLFVSIISNSSSALAAMAPPLNPAVTAPCKHSSQTNPTATLSSLTLSSLPHCYCDLFCSFLIESALSNPHFAENQKYVAFLTTISLCSHLIPAC